MRTKFLLFIVSALILASCSNTKYLPEGELLYVGGKVKIEDKSISKKERKALKKELEALLRPKPNKKILGLRPKLYIYNIAGEPKKEKGFRHWLRTKVGEPPVTFGKVDLKYNSDLLQNYAENKGYFNALATADSTRHGKKATADYTIKTGKQFKIHEVLFPADTSDGLEKAVAQTWGRSRSRSLLKPGDGYDLDVIKAERERIDNRLKQKGYYFFNPDYLKVQVDSTVGNHQVDLTLVVKDEMPDQARNVYKINEIIIYPNYSINSANKITASDSITKYNDFTIVDPEHTFKPRIFDRTLYFHKGDVYNRNDHNLSLNRLVNLGTFKFVKNNFKVSDKFDNMLDAYYYLTPLPRKSIRVEILGKTNSANYTGTELNVSWSNRNTFHGAELLTLSGFGGAEVQVSGQNKGYNVYRIGGEANLYWPRIIAPFKFTTASGFLPRTRAMIGYEFQKRIKLYGLNTFRASFGYQFKESAKKEHQLNVTEITYVNPSNVSDVYKQQVNETPALSKVIERQLIFGPTYSFTYQNTLERRRKNTFYFKGQIDLAGTVAGLVTGANINQGDTTKLLNVPFSQYVRTEAEVRHYFKYNREGTVQQASRLIVGAGFPYGNSRELPFIKQFFIGGTNSIRAFRARSIGPGTFNPDVEANTFLPDQSGDLKLEANTEFRAKLVSVVNGAVFVDAGNIWLMHDDPDKPGAKFSSKFLDEIAVGTGIGLRFDLSFLVLRTDLAFPLRKPYLPEGQRWVFDQINFGDGPWRRENLVFNLAIGYPF